MNSALLYQDAEWATTQLSVQLAVSGITDPGGATKVNQDAFFVHNDNEHRVLVVGVFDGHGKEVGRDVAMASKDFFESQFQAFTQKEYQKLERDPQHEFQQLFEACHTMLTSLLRCIYERRGYVVTEEQPGSYLVKQDPETHKYTCIRGGTTATIVVILDGGRKILTANVGDSAALLAAPLHMMDNQDVNVYEAGGVSRKRCSVIATGSSDSSNNIPLDISAENEYGDNDRNEESKAVYPTHPNILLLSGDHGADSKSEFIRARSACASQFNVHMPELRFLYDSSDVRTRRSPVFYVNHNGEMCRNQPGDYYKNVRDEWATVVAAPASAFFADALAFTRSLGDFHMHAYGVCCEPTVTEISLERVVDREMSLDTSRIGGNQEEVRLAEVAVDESIGHNQQDIDEHIVSGFTTQRNTASRATEFILVVASDGIWDNWKYDELFRSLFKLSAQKSLRNESSGRMRVDKMASALMQANLKRASVVFGDQADNMTAILCHFMIASTSCLTDILK